MKKLINSIKYKVIDVAALATVTTLLLVLVIVISLTQSRWLKMLVE